MDQEKHSGIMSLSMSEKRPLVSVIMRRVES
jgi:hypothetical protein